MPTTIINRATILIFVKVVGYTSPEILTVLFLFS